MIKNTQQKSHFNEKHKHLLPQTCLITSTTLQSHVKTAINILCLLFQNTRSLAGCSDSHEMLVFIYIKKKIRHSIPASCFSVLLFRAYD